jgi:predicted nucleic acid-binding protein
MEGQPESFPEKSGLILVDSSVWVDFFSSSPGRGGGELRRMIEDCEPVALTGVIVTEVLQGLTRDARAIEQFLRQFDMLEPGGFETYRSAATI